MRIALSQGWHRFPGPERGQWILARVSLDHKRQDRWEPDR